MNQNEETKEAGTTSEAEGRKGLFRMRNLLITGGVIGLLGVGAVGAVAATDDDEGKDGYAEKSWSVGYGGEKPEEGQCGQTPLGQEGGQERQTSELDHQPQEAPEGLRRLGRDEQGSEAEVQHLGSRDQAEDQPAMTPEVGVKVQPVLDLARED